MYNFLFFVAPHFPFLEAKKTEENGGRECEKTGQVGHSPWDPVSRINLPAIWDVRPPRDTPNTLQEEHIIALVGTNVPAAPDEGENEEPQHLFSLPTHGPGHENVYQYVLCHACMGFWGEADTHYVQMRYPQASRECVGHEAALSQTCPACGGCSFFEAPDPITGTQAWSFRGITVGGEGGEVPWVYLGSRVVGDPQADGVLVSLHPLEGGYKPDVSVFFYDDNIPQNGYTLCYDGSGALAPGVPSSSSSSTGSTALEGGEESYTTTPPESLVPSQPDWMDMDEPTSGLVPSRRDPTCVCPFPCIACGTLTIGEMNVIVATDFCQTELPETLDMSETIKKVNSETALHIEAWCKISTGDWAKLRFLVDTGATYSMIKRDVIPFDSTQPLPRKICLTGVTGDVMGGCDRVATIKMQFDVSIAGTAPSELQGTTHYAGTYGKFIVCEGAGGGLNGIDGILSFTWLAQRHILVDTHNHKLIIPPAWDVAGRFQVNNELNPRYSFSIPGLRYGANGRGPTPIQVEMARRRTMWDPSYVIPYPANPAPGQLVRQIRPILEVDEEGRALQENPVCPLPGCIFAPHHTHMKKLVKGYLTAVLPRMRLETLIKRNVDQWRSHCEKSCGCERYGFTFHEVEGKIIGLYNLLPPAAAECTMQFSSRQRAAMRHPRFQDSQNSGPADSRPRVPQPVVPEQHNIVTPNATLKLIPNYMNCFWLCPTCLHFWGDIRSRYVHQYLQEKSSRMAERQAFNQRVIDKCDECGGTRTTCDYMVNDRETLFWEDFSGRCDRDGIWIYLGSDSRLLKDGSPYYPGFSLHLTTLRDGTRPDGIVEYVTELDPEIKGLGIIHTDLPFDRYKPRPEVYRTQYEAKGDAAKRLKERLSSQQTVPASHDSSYPHNLGGPSSTSALRHPSAAWWRGYPSGGAGDSASEDAYVGQWGGVDGHVRVMTRGKAKKDSDACEDTPEPSNPGQGGGTTGADAPSSVFSPSHVSLDFVEVGDSDSDVHIEEKNFAQSSAGTPSSPSSSLPLPPHRGLPSQANAAQADQPPEQPRPARAGPGMGKERANPAQQKKKVDRKQKGVVKKEEDVPSPSLSSASSDSVYILSPLHGEGEHQPDPRPGSPTPPENLAVHDIFNYDLLSEELQEFVQETPMTFPVPPIEDPPVLPAGLALPTPAGMPLGDLPPQPEGECVCDGIAPPGGLLPLGGPIDMENAPLLAALFNDPANILVTLGITDPQNWNLHPLPERQPVPLEALGMELSPAYLADLRSLGDCVRGLAPVVEDPPVYAEVPENFWLCENCWGVWGRAEMRYTVHFFLEQDRRLEDLMPYCTKTYENGCDSCGGTLREHCMETTPDQQGPGNRFYSCDGTVVDRRGAWYYLDKILTEEAPTERGYIIKLTLWILATCPTPTIAFYRLRDFETPWDKDFYKRRVEWEEQTNYPSKRSRANPFPKDLGPHPWPPLDEAEQNFDLCDECLGYWVKWGTRYLLRWEEGNRVMKVRGAREDFAWMHRCDKCLGELFHRDWEGSGDQRGSCEWTTGDKDREGERWFYVGSDIIPVVYPRTPNHMGTVKIYLPKLRDLTRPDHICHVRSLHFTTTRPHLREPYIAELQRYRESTSSSSSSVQHGGGGFFVVVPQEEPESPHQSSAAHAQLPHCGFISVRSLLDQRPTPGPQSDSLPNARDQGKGSPLNPVFILLKGEFVCWGMTAQRTPTLPGGVTAQKKIRESLRTSGVNECTRVQSILANRRVKLPGTIQKKICRIAIHSKLEAPGTCLLHPKKLQKKNSKKKVTGCDPQESRSSRPIPPSPEKIMEKIQRKICWIATHR